MDINRNNNATNSYAITTLVTNAFNRCIDILSGVSSYIPFFSRETNSNYLLENNTAMERREVVPPDSLEYLEGILVYLQIDLQIAIDWEEISYSFRMGSGEVERIRKKIAKTYKKIAKKKQEGKTTYNKLKRLEQLDKDELKQLDKNKLEQLKANNNIETCNISLEELKQGDTVCCDGKLYSFNYLKKWFEKQTLDQRTPTIPHNRQPLTWDNVFTLPDYGNKSDQ